MNDYTKYSSRTSSAKCTSCNYNDFYNLQQVSETKFQLLLQRTASRFRSEKALADRLGIGAPRLNRALNKGDFSFNVLNCLRLADASGEHPSEVLRAAGKGDVADLIERLYGVDAEPLASDEREVVELYRGLPDEVRQSALTFLRATRVGGSARTEERTGKRRRSA